MLKTVVCIFFTIPKKSPHKQDRISIVPLGHTTFEYYFHTHTLKTANHNAAFNIILQYIKYSDWTILLHDYETHISKVL